ncbi:MAG TPA: ATP-binding SpoIIE family protein phosphatase [Alphaproteobacteria bacterium]|nr:ATP-binding SpoIIE family protein phosphatase [Alphaproteobacteria bacterium]
MAQVIPVTLMSDVYVARQAARDMARAMGFDEDESEAVVLAVSELASNLVKYAQGGTLTLMPVNDGERVGLRIESHDTGPGIANTEQAIVDGFSTAGSLGYGLGSVNRLMSQFDITSQCGAGAGTHIVCTRWLRTDAPPANPCPLEFGAASRPYSLLSVNGDAFVIKRWSASALVGLIDGVGHGQDAHHAAQTARQYVETHCDQPLDAIFRGVGRACRATRGVVMALVRFDFKGNDIRFSCASIGNIEAHLFGVPNRQPFIVRRGILGVNAPIPQVTEHRWQAGAVLVLHSDGVSSRWGLADFPRLATESATTTAQSLLRALAKEHDDATVVVVKDRAHERERAATTVG